MFKQKSIINEAKHGRVWQPAWYGAVQAIRLLKGFFRTNRKQQPSLRSHYCLSSHTDWKVNKSTTQLETGKGRSWRQVGKILAVWQRSACHFTVTAQCIWVTKRGTIWLWARNPKCHCNGNCTIFREFMAMYTLELFAIFGSISNEKPTDPNTSVAASHMVPSAENTRVLFSCPILYLKSDRFSLSFPIEM